MCGLGVWKLPFVRPLACAGGRSALKSVHWTDLTGYAGRASPIELHPQRGSLSMRCSGPQIMEDGGLTP